MAIVNWKKAEEFIASGNYKEVPARYAHNVYNEKTHMATSTMKDEVLMLDASELPGLVYLLPTPKSPHGCDVDPTGEYIVGSGKLSANLTVHSFTKMLDAIENGDVVVGSRSVPGGKLDKHWGANRQLASCQSTPTTGNKNPVPCKVLVHAHSPRITARQQTRS